MSSPWATCSPKWLACGPWPSSQLPLSAFQLLLLPQQMDSSGSPTLLWFLLPHALLSSAKMVRRGGWGLGAQAASEAGEGTGLYILCVRDCAKLPALQVGAWLGGGRGVPHVAGWSHIAHTWKGREELGCPCSQEAMRELGCLWYMHSRREGYARKPAQ